MAFACKVEARDGEVEGEEGADADTCADGEWYRAGVRSWAATGGAKEADEGAGYESMLSSMVSESSGPSWCGWCRCWWCGGRSWG